MSEEPIEPTVPKYLVAYASQQKFGDMIYGSIELTVTGAFTPNTLILVRDHIRRKTGLSKAFVLSFSKFDA